MSKIINIIVHANGHGEVVVTKPGQRFEDSKGGRYDAAGSGETVRLKLDKLGSEKTIAVYREGTPKAKPALCEKPHGLTVQDLNNIDGPWIVNLARRALVQQRKEEIKFTMLFVLIGVTILAQLIMAYFVWQINGKL